MTGLAAVGAVAALVTAACGGSSFPRTVRVEFQMSSVLQLQQHAGSDGISSGRVSVAANGTPNGRRADSYDISAGNQLL